MSVAYALAYRLGITPWEKGGAGGHEQLAELFAREELSGFGRVLDVGCGRGGHTVDLARRGWEATGIDLEPQAVAAARRRAGSSSARFVVGDVTNLPPSVGGDYRFVIDLGCYQGLRPEARPLFGSQITAATTADATLLVLGFSPGSRLPPRGTDAADLERSLPGWTIDDVTPAVTTGMPKPMAARSPQFYRLRRA